MKTAKLVIGILTIVFSGIVTLQSCAVGVIDAVEGSDSASSGAGMLVGFIFLVGGIIGIAARKSKGGTLTAGCFYAVGGLIGIANASTYPDLIVWAVMSLAFAIVFLFSGVKMRKTEED